MNQIDAYRAKMKIFTQRLEDASHSTDIESIELSFDTRQKLSLIHI